MINKECMGKCPNCDSDDLDYGSLELESINGEAVYYEFTCNKCGKSGKEWYNLEYTESISYKDDEEWALEK